MEGEPGGGEGSPRVGQERPSTDSRPLIAVRDPTIPGGIALERAEGKKATKAVALAGMETLDVAEPGAEAEEGALDAAARRRGATEAVANIVNCILAAGAVGGAYALLNTGVVTGVVLYVLSAALMDASLKLLVHVAARVRIFDYQGLCARALGVFGYVYTSAVQWGQGYGCMVTYLMVAADTVESVLRMVLALAGSSADGRLGAVLTDRRAIVAAVLCVVLPLCFLRNISSLAKTSYVSIASVVFIAAAVMYKCAAGVELAEGQLEPVPTHSIVSGSILEGLGIAAFSFVTHHESLILYQGLGDRSERNWGSIVHYSMTVACACLLAIAIPGYLTFYGTTTSNILNNYPNDDVFMTLCRLLFGATMLLSYPLEHFVARTVALDLLRCPCCRAHGTSSGSAAAAPAAGNPRLRYTVVTLVLVLSSALIAMFTRDLGAVLTLTGGVCASSLAYILPAIMYLRLVKARDRARTALAITLIAVGSILALGCPAWVVYRLMRG